MTRLVPHLRLVAPQLNGQNVPVQSIGARAHWAYHCMRRDERGRPPPISAVEKSVGLSNARLQKILSGDTENPSLQTVEALARAFGVSFEWLAFNRGEPPQTAYHIPPWNPEAYRSGVKRPRRRKVIKMPSTPSSAH